MKKRLFFGILTIFLLSFISAQVSITQAPPEISSRLGETQNYSLTLNNTFDFSVSDFKFGTLSSLGFTFPSDLIVNQNSTKAINFTVTPTSSFSGQRIEKVEFKFLANIPTEITIYHINITSTGFNPTYLTIREGDSVEWFNKDSISHNVFLGSTTLNVAPNSTNSYTFGAIGNYTYIDPNWGQYFQGFSGRIDVIGRTSQEKVHNPIYDFNWTINLNFFLNPTNITFNISDDSSEVSATGKTEGLITIKNIGTERAERINLTSNSNWVSFQENNFNLNQNEQNIIVYEISPLIFSTNETNKTYTINLTVSGSNIEPQTRQILVFVPYTEIFQDTGSAEFVFALLDKFCKANPNNLFCNPIRNITITGNNSNQSLTLNVTSADFFDFLRRLAGIETNSLRQENQLSSLQDNYNTKLINIESNSSASYDKQLENEKKARRNLNIFWIFFTIFLIAGCIIFMFWKYKRVRRKQMIKEGAFEYKT